MTGRIEAGQAVLSARRRAWPVVTSDPEPLRAVEPDLEIELLP